MSDTRNLTMLHDEAVKKIGEDATKAIVRDVGEASSIGGVPDENIVALKNALRDAVNGAPRPRGAKRPNVDLSARAAFENNGGAVDTTALKKFGNASGTGLDPEAVYAKWNKPPPVTADDDED